MGTDSEFLVAGRTLSYRDARFLPGRGEGFVGVWDRTRPAEPIERFRPGVAGEGAAIDRVHQLLFDEEVSLRATPGVRLYLPPTEPRLVEVDVTKRPGVPVEIREQVPSYFVLATGAPWLLLEEDEDAPSSTGEPVRWFRLYRLDSSRGLPLVTAGGYETAKAAQEAAAREDDGRGEWLEIPQEVPRTLRGALRWAQRHLLADEQAIEHPSEPR